jgi:hypothetical protein
MSVSPASAALTAPTDLDFTGGGTVVKQDLSLQAVTVRANATWSMTMQGSAWTGTGNNAKAIGDLTWSKNGIAGPFAAMTSSAVALNNGGATANAVTTLTFRTTWTLATDTPGTYTMNITFVGTAP